jgi:hypothetical protein
LISLRRSKAINFSVVILTVDQCAAANTSIANMAADGTNSASALSLNFCFGGRATIGLQFLYLAFVTSIKL